MIRTVKLEDISFLLELEEKCWVPELRASKDVLLNRINRNPDTIFVLENPSGNGLAGVLYTQRISSNSIDTLASPNGFTKLESFFDKYGDVLEMIAINVDNKLVKTGANDLRNYAFKVASADSSIKKVIAMTRCSTFDSSKGSYEHYVKSHNDSTIFFHVSGGASIIKIVSDYRTEDKVNNGHGILIEYKNFRNSIVTDSSFSVKLTDDINIKEKIISKVNQFKFTDSEALKNFNEQTPFMNLLDSIQMIELFKFIENTLNTTLPPDFLFKYPSALAVEKSLTNSSITSEDYFNFEQKEEPVAIVGVGFRLPGGITTLDDLWAAQSQGKSFSSEVDLKKRWGGITRQEILDQLDGDSEKARAALAGNFLEDITGFDPSLFGISHQESLELDPNQRLALEVVYRALYDCNQADIDSHQGKLTSVFLALSNSDYSDVEGGGGFRTSDSVYAATGSAASMAAGRIAYVLGTIGAAYTVDSACSSSLVALHNAFVSLQRGDCKQCIVASVNLMLAPYISIAFARAGMLSPEGHCQTFDNGANGYCRGEGAIAFVLKKLSDVDQEKESVYAVIRGTDVLHHGRGASLTAPNSTVQSLLLRRTLQKANLTIDDISFIEAHGTGTKLGDPIEIAAIADVFGKSTQSINISSIKANFGHLESTAGMIGILSALGTLKNHATPPNRGLKKLNDMISSIICDTKLNFPTSLTPVQPRSKSGTIIGGVSSFGYSGTIAHVILEEFKGSKLPVSNDPFAHLSPKLKSNSQSKLVFQFTGQGNLKVKACEKLLKNSAYSTALKDVDPIVKSYTGYTLSDVLYPTSLKVNDAEALLDDPIFSQVYLVALEYALFKAWTSCGYNPTHIMGHSLGEYTACIISGVFSLTDGLKLVYERAKLVVNEDKCKGKMCVIFVTPDDAYSEYDSCSSDMKEKFSIAVVNGSKSVVISGEPSAVDEFCKSKFPSSRQIPLKMKYAFHSPLLKNVQEDFRKLVEGVKKNVPSITFISTASDYVGIIDGKELLTSEYWVRHMVKSVRFDKASIIAASLGTSEHPVIIAELGPVDTLTQICGPIATEFKEKVVYIASCNASYTDSGSAFDNIYKPVDIPFFIESRLSKSKGLNDQKRILLKEKFDMINLHGDNINDHILYGHPVIAGAAFLDLISYISVVTSPSLNSSDFVSFKDFAVTKPFIYEGSIIDKDIEITRNNSTVLAIVNKVGDVELFRNESKTSFASASLDWKVNHPQNIILESKDFHDVDINKFYAVYSNRGLIFGPSFSLLSSIKLSSDNKEASATITLKAPSVSGTKYSSIPAQWLDNMIHACGIFFFPFVDGIDSHSRSEDSIYIPFTVDEVNIDSKRIKYLQSLSDYSTATILIRTIEADSEGGIFDVSLIEKDQVLVSIKGLNLRATNPEAILKNIDDSNFNAVHVGIPKFVRDSELSQAITVDQSTSLAIWGEVNELKDEFSKNGLKNIEYISLNKVGSGKDLVVILPLELSKFIPVELGEKLKNLINTLAHLSSLNNIKQVIGLGFITSGDNEIESVFSTLSASLLSARNENLDIQWNSLLINGSISFGVKSVLDLLSFGSNKDYSPELYYDESTNSRFVKRIIPHLSYPAFDVQTPIKNIESEKYSVNMSERGSIDNLKLTKVNSPLITNYVRANVKGALALSHEEIGKGLVNGTESPVVLNQFQIIVNVECVSLNFRDVLNVLGMYPGDPGNPGCELGGIVVAVGSGLKHISIGDRIIGFASGGMAEQVILDGRSVVKLPESIDIVYGCTLPVVFSTVYWGLHDLAKLSKGDVALIHSGAGGIGLAAIKYALSVGARVISTTSSPQKVELLKRLGVEEVFSSRDSSLFTESLKTWIDKEISVNSTFKGISVVLNALSGDFIPASVKYICKEGHFVELGKRGIWTDEQMKKTRRDVNYHVLALDSMAANEQEKFRDLLERVCNTFTSGQWGPIPCTILDLYTDYSTAYNILKAGKNIGKVVLRVADYSKTPSNDAQVVLLSGGTGSLGCALALQLVQSFDSIKHIILASTSGKFRDDVSTISTKLLTAAETKGVKVHLLTTDLSDAKQVEDLIHSEIPKLSNGLKVDAVIHCAGVVRDGLLHGGAALKDADIVWNSKALSAWNLHNSTLKNNLKFFVTLSSIVGCIGREGQSVYASSNRFLDELVKYRTSSGIPGRSLSIQLPAISDIGMATHNVALDSWSLHSEWVRKVIINALNNRDSSELNFAPTTTDIIFHYPNVVTLFPASLNKILDDSLVQQFKPTLKFFKTQNSSQNAEFIHDSKTNVGSLTIKELEELVTEKAKPFLPSVPNLSLHDNLLTLGIDSLSATELSGSLGRSLSLRLSPTLVFNYHSIALIAKKLHELLAPQRESNQNGSSTVANTTTTNKNSQLNTTSNVYHPYISIIGVGMRLPGEIHSLDDLHFHMNNKSLLTSANPPSRGWTVESVLGSSDQLKRRSVTLQSVKYGGYLSDNDLYCGKGPDYHITDMEWNNMDVRQKLALAVTNEALADAGFSNKDRLSTLKVGVFGACLGQLRTAAKPWEAAPDPNEKPSVFDATSNSLGVLSGRISFLYGFQGPAFTVDTACSSSLVAIHLAKNALHNRECDIAIVVGVNTLDPELSVSFALAGMLSPDGHCHTFDSSANGYCRGEGAGAIVLCRHGEEEYLAEFRDNYDQQGAERDDGSKSSTHKVYALLKGSSVQQDGKSASLTAPNGLAQESLIRAALSDAGLDPTDISYIEAHGTGTKIGDPLEVEALSNIFSNSIKRENSNHKVLVGSVKANIGHLEACAGMAGLFSCLSIIRYKEVCPNAALTKINPALIRPRDASFLDFPTNPVSLVRNDINIGLSSFGYSGTISHIIIGKYVEGSASGVTKVLPNVPLSPKSNLSTPIATRLSSPTKPKNFFKPLEAPSVEDIAPPKVPVPEPENIKETNKQIIKEPLKIETTETEQKAKDIIPKPSKKTPPRIELPESPKSKRTSSHNSGVSTPVASSTHFFSNKSNILISKGYEVFPEYLLRHQSDWFTNTDLYEWEFNSALNNIKLLDILVLTASHSLPHFHFKSFFIPNNTLCGYVVPPKHLISTCVKRKVEVLTLEHDDPSKRNSVFTAYPTPLNIKLIEEAHESGILDINTPFLKPVFAESECEKHEIGYFVSKVSIDRSFIYDFDFKSLYKKSELEWIVGFSPLLQTSLNKAKGINNGRIFSLALEIVGAVLFYTDKCGGECVSIESVGSIVSTGPNLFNYTTNGSINDGELRLLFRLNNDIETETDASFSVIQIWNNDYSELLFEIKSIDIKFLKTTTEDEPVLTESEFHSYIKKAQAIIDSVLGSDDSVNLGMDSLTSTELSNQLSDEFSIELTPSQVLEATSKQNIVEMVLEKLGILNKYLGAVNKAPAGDTYKNNPFFANYFVDDEDDDIEEIRREDPLATPGQKHTLARLVIFGGMAHPAVSWHNFVKPIVAKGVSCHIGKFAGRFERIAEPEFSCDCAENVKALCEALIELGLARLPEKVIKKEKNADGEEVEIVEYVHNYPPLAFLGYSYGAAMAYSCARFLEHEYNVKVTHFFPLAGPDRNHYEKWVFLNPDDPADRTIERFVEYHEVNMGRMNPLFDLNLRFIPQLLQLIFEVFFRDLRTALSFVKQFDELEPEKRLISCNITCLNGDQDISVAPGSWLSVAKPFNFNNKSEKYARYEELSFPGDHFYLYHNPALDNHVANVIVSAIKRGLNIFD